MTLYIILIKKIVPSLHHFSYRFFHRCVFTILHVLFFSQMLCGDLFSSVTVNSVEGLQNAVNSANNGGDETILIADGTYLLNGTSVYITRDGITIRGESGKRDGVILDGEYIEAGGEIFLIRASNVTIADLTVMRAYYHPVHITPGDDRNTENITLDNLHIIDPGQQAIKINANAINSPTYTVSKGVVSNSIIELTSSGRSAVITLNGSCYTGGIDAHWATGWAVRNNTIQGFWCPDDLSEHGIHFWNNSKDILVERNLIIDCDRGIGFGLGASGNSGGIIRNNMIYHPANHGQSDVGIGIESTSGTQIYNNTIFHEHDYSAIEYRFSSTTNIIIANNLSNREITQRDSASAIVSNNVTSAFSSWFTDLSRGDLHLASSIASVVDKGQIISGLIDDYDCDSRPINGGIDIGADEFSLNGGGDRCNEVHQPDVSWKTLEPWLFLLLNKT